MDLLEEIETRVAGDNDIYVYFLGHAGYVIKTPMSIIYIDPYLSDYIENQDGLDDIKFNRKFPPQVDPRKMSLLDAVFVTHSHADHMDPWTLESISTPYKLYCTEIAFRNNTVEIENENVVYVLPGEEYVIKDITVLPILSSHGKFNDAGDKKPVSVSYVIKAYGKVFFFWGDGTMYNGLLGKLKNHNYDYFFAPINGRDWFREKNNIVGNINIKELVGISKAIKIGCLLPNHFEMFDVNGENPEHFLFHIKKENPRQKVLILKPGASIKVT